MIRTRYSASLLVLALGSAIAFAGDGGITTKPAPVPAVTNVGFGPARDPGIIVIEGRNLGIVLEARLNGGVLPILRNTGYELWIRPGPQDPGFGKLQLAYPSGVVNAMVEFLPTLRADHKVRTIDLILHGEGEGGFYVLNFSYKVRPTPLYHPGIYYMEWLDMGSPFSGVVGADFFHSTAIETFRWERLGLINRPVFFQSMCVTPDGDMCYSNAVAVFHGHPSTGDAPTGMK